MILDELLSALVYLAAVLVVFALGAFVYARMNRGVSLREELIERDNLALALAVAGYFLGLVFALGGVLTGASLGLVEDLIDLAIYGVLSVVLLNVSIVLNEKLILYRFRKEDEIIRDRNVGAGLIEAANHVAVGLVIYGAVSGVGGGLATFVVFWVLGQVVLVAAGLVYEWVTPFDVHAEIERDNVAVGAAFAGILVALGNIIRVGAQGDFVSWEENLTTFGLLVAFGLVLLPVLRTVVDRVVLPGQRLTHELTGQAHPNVGIGAIEACSYIAASFLLGWVY